ncbi:peptidoglycan D,D-transpeptidase FtsI family protein [Reinekea marinisedimentorum]|uniref:Peptidoglycan D,D-transpeptidase FtsI n=1 Tax=Reinekea marinisedimentorum TaxID=230495 RepID=A0A4R3I8R9_9GAMM|nr:penicillin-binding protein 2 [Reinekea marinisedimentorum]TCS41722.1 cell division protein FtsI (penicillin-binding protein 3) [Reinekea marinisedimentorum]
MDRASWRYTTVQIGLLALLSVTVWRVVYLQVLQKDFLISEGTSRWQRIEVVNAPRGMLTDRYGRAMAVSTPVISLWADPREINKADIPVLAKASGVSEKTLAYRADHHRAFMYIRRQMNPEEAQVVLDLGLKGVYGQKEYKRYYPAGEVAAQVVGFTDVDDHGQEGIELAFDAQLSATSGKKEVIRDLMGRSVRDVGELTASEAGDNLNLTIDLRLQYLAYRELKSAIAKTGAASGSVVMMDVKTGEVLALVNQPGYNPNDRSTITAEALRNRAVTDGFEPGSIMKPITMSIALEQGLVTPNSKINTSPGRLRLGKFSIRDFRDYGELTATEVIKKSSNVGIVKIAKDLDRDVFWQTLYNYGLGTTPGIGFPGEASGALPNPMRWDDVRQGALAYGYGLSVSPILMAQAYATLANGGKRVHARLIQNLTTVDDELQVVSERTANQVIEMMKTVVEPGGTASRAHLDWYSVAGKTGTSHKIGAQGYEDAKYTSSFVGIAPANNPQVVTVVVINEPPEDAYYGGEIPASIFNGVMTQALPLMNINPDQAPLLGEGSK